MKRNDRHTGSASLDAIRELSRLARHIPLEELQTLVYDLEHSAPLSAECALARAFLAWRKQLEQLGNRAEW